MPRTFLPRDSPRGLTVTTTERWDLQRTLSGPEERTMGCQGFHSGPACSITWAQGPPTQDCLATVPSQVPPDKAYSCTPLMALTSDAAGLQDRLGFTPKGGMRVLWSLLATD